MNTRNLSNKNIMKYFSQFTYRHIGSTHAEQKFMLKKINCKSFKDLLELTLPKNILINKNMNIPVLDTEIEMLDEMSTLSRTNLNFKNFIGMGYYNNITPSVIHRNMIQDPSWYTAYTPYQPEISQGRLEMLMNFQQVIIDLTKMDIANASLLDEGTAAAEAMTLCFRHSLDKKRNLFLIHSSCHPQTISVVQTRSKPINLEIKLIDEIIEEDLNKSFGILVQYPDTFGHIDDLDKIIKKSHKHKNLVCVATDLLSLTLLKPPGELGADVVFGNSQRLGVPLGFGGPHAAFFATKDIYKRSMPGRIIGLTIDQDKKQTYRMAMQTREQHIRRDKATSNICTAQALLANVSAAFAIYHGPEGLKSISENIHEKTKVLALGLKEKFNIHSKDFFDTIVIDTNKKANRFYFKALNESVNLRQIDEDLIGISLDETTRKKDIVKLWSIFGLNFQYQEIYNKLKLRNNLGIAFKKRRKSSFLDHPIFHKYRSETEMMRYLKILADKDIALNRSMIPLGSCTMKLNASTELIPIAYRGFARIHPFVPSYQVKGYLKLIEDLNKMLCLITGFDQISLQPNSGAQGEYAGLMTIKAYLDDKGQKNRNICFIPKSSHGTNPASAIMAGMKVVVIECDDFGNVDIQDLLKKVSHYSDELAALMITYPSTHGVFEQEIVRICEIIHSNGGQVYMDGANLNALVGVAKPALFGPDVCHINLHKTFCIPHGGGGPGVGPIAVKKHLSKFLPSHIYDPFKSEKEKSFGTVSSAPWGSASILPISYAYIRMMGGSGLRQATAVAILHANYIAKQLSNDYSILYKGQNNKVAHECIVDIRPIKKDIGISEEDIAKRLIDYGFHAPTMSFPVPGTLMIEPTESESKEEIDRFCDAMISIKKEIIMIKENKYSFEDNPLINAPHTASELINKNWNHCYSKKVAYYPDHRLIDNKYWPPVKRIDNVYGDRNLFCACPPIEDYKKSDNTG